MIVKDKMLEPFFLDISETGVTVKEPTNSVDKDGNIINKNISYFSTPKGALYDIIKLKIARRETTVDLVTYIRMWQKAIDKLETLTIGT